MRTKYFKKLIALILITLTLSNLFSFNVSAEWIKYDNGWCYSSDGFFHKSGWAKIDGKWYLFDDEGYMKTGWQKSGNDWYYLGDYGSMRTGWLQQGGCWYYLKSNGAMAYGTVTINNKQEVFDDNGIWQYTKTQSVQTKSNSKSVYVTPTGKKYHYSRSCAGKNATATTLDNAKKLHTPCKKCAM